MKSRRFLVPLILLITAALLLLRLLRTTFLTQFLFISVVFGPGMAISYGLGNPLFRPLAHLSLLLLFELLSVLFLYSILHLLPTEKRFENKILDKVATYIHKSRREIVGRAGELTLSFRRSFGDLGFYMALGLVSFAYGVYVAGIVAYFLRIRLKRAIIAISIGGAVAIVFWWYMALGLVPFLTPTIVFMVVTGASAFFLVYGWVRENRILRSMAGEFLEKGDRLTRRILGSVDKFGQRKR